VCCPVIDDDGHVGEHEKAVDRIKGAKRMDQLVTQSGNAAPNLSEIDSVGRTLLDYRNRSRVLSSRVVESVESSTWPDAGSGQRRRVKANPDTQASQLVAKVANALAVFEIWLKTNEDRAVATCTSQLRNPFDRVEVVGLSCQMAVSYES
jgi:hypothetical protein